MGNSFLRALWCVYGIVHRSQQLQAETRCQPIARSMTRRGARCLREDWEAAAHGLKMRQPPRHRWHPSRSVKASALADPEGGVAGVATPPLIFQKIVVIRVAVVIYLVVTSSNNVCLCVSNGVVIGYYSTTVKKALQ